MNFFPNKLGSNSLLTYLSCRIKRVVANSCELVLSPADPLTFKSRACYLIRLQCWQRQAVWQAI